uniref:Uncharacterized protein n=1 Tax=Siphoviridae sp. ctOb14 TaxID=2827862 RepID=A0A8S5SM88_9CAUD|nr:MAG TPA: hypothetical protein [Siphoviridae sp. ctOb14]
MPTGEQRIIQAFISREMDDKAELADALNNA